MKKQVYISPKTEIITIVAHSMICTSGNSVDVGENYSSETTTTLSRRGSIWDDEDE